MYQNICDKYLVDIAAAKDIYRVYGDIQLFDKLNGNYRALFAMETVQAAKTRLQKLIAIENIRKKILTQLAYLNCVSPFSLQDDPLYKISKEQAGVNIQTKDSTVYYNIDPNSAVAKISLYNKAAGQLYIQNRFSEIIDSVAIQPGKCDLLQKEKTDVFLLCRGWLELQWQGALSAIRRQNGGLYNQVNVQNVKEVKELYSQLNTIGEKINQLNSPEAKSLEQAVYDTYKSETSEISYIPLLGIVYETVLKRGEKEYELTNQLGNVLATVSDKKIGVSYSSNSSLIDHYEPDIVSAQDYYPFGMLQPGRAYLSPNGEKYRYGFNGKEDDNEVKGDGNQQDYGMRVYDPRLGRFLSVDPLTKDYAQLTPYQFASNKPIWAIDLDGLEGWELTNRTNELKQQGIRAINYDPIQDVLRRDIYNPEILKLDMHGVAVIGKKSNVERNIASVKLQHDIALGEQIASGPGAAIGYLGWSEKGAASFTYFVSCIKYYTY
ncbi:RHS repeat-associated core domain-containing protein [Niastella yeongjuensis]|nr:RHS repeat-associated core domain-containing protein [Niastella yeongjuensis]